MLPGPDKVICCLSCGGLERHVTLRSFVELTVHIWTDGFRLAEERPQAPAIIKCGQCSHVYWLEDASVLGELDTRNTTASPHEWRRAQRVLEPQEADYYVALAAGLGRTRKEERTARILAWWKSNEPLRGDLVTRVYDRWDFLTDLSGAPKKRHQLGQFNVDPPARQSNMELLLPLLDRRDPGDRLMKAEVLRELGRFEQARLALDQVEYDPLAGIVDQIRALCDEGDSLVRYLILPERRRHVVQRRGCLSLWRRR